MMKLFNSKKEDKPALPAFNNIPVIQLGIGGAPSSGKTVLIDALFRLMGAFRPTYIKDSNLVDNSKIELVEIDRLYPENTLKGFYKNIHELNGIVTKNFHNNGIQTVDTGNWNENMYKAMLLENGVPKLIFLVRNISGEMIKTYYGLSLGTVNLKKTLDTYFTEFISGITTSDIPFKDARSVGKTAEVTLTGFIEHVKLSEKTATDVIAGALKIHFFAYCFFRTSKYFIYCIDPLNDNSKDDHLLARDVIEEMQNKAMQSFYVVTKIDKYFDHKRILNNVNLNSKKEGNGDSYELFDILSIESKNDYWNVMKYLYERIYNTINEQEGEFDVLLNAENKHLLLSLFNHDYIPPQVISFNDNGAEKSNVFFTTTAFHRKHQFIGFDADYVANGLNDSAFWNPSINSARMSLGVLELWLRILNDTGFSIKNLDILPPGKKAYNEIYKKIIGVN